MNQRLPAVVLGASALFLVGLAGFVLWELRGVEERLARLEAAAGPGARVSRTRAGEPAPSGPISDGQPIAAPAAAGSADAAAHEVDTLRGDVTRLAAVVQALESQLGEVTRKAATLEQEAAALKTRAAEAQISTAIAQVTEGEGNAASLEAQAAGTLAWLEAELDKTAEEVGLNSAQRDQAQAALAELSEKYFPKDRKPEEMWKDWQQFQNEYRDRIKALMTSEQQNRYAAYQKKQVQEQVTSTTTYMVATLAKTAGLSDAQRDRVKAKLKDYYGKMYSAYYEGGGMVSVTADDNTALRDAIRSELSADQFDKFDGWYKTYLGGQMADTGGGGE